jgi:hypothetical protein
MRYSELLKREHQKRSRKTKFVQESVVYIKGRKSILKTIAVYNKFD